MCSYTTGQARLWSEYNNQEECEENGGRWFTEYGYIDIDTTANSLPLCMSRNNSLPRNYRAVWSHANWAEPDESCLILGPPPECTQVGWSRVNHLGNGRDGVPLNYTWKIPHFLNNGNKLAVIRMRYEFVRTCVEGLKKRCKGRNRVGDFVWGIFCCNVAQL